MTFLQGDIVLVRYPFSNMVDYKIRPVVVVSNNKFNKINNIWASPITSKKRKETLSINDSLIEGKLDSESFVRANIVAVFEDEVILKKIGKISVTKINELVQKLISNF